MINGAETPSLATLLAKLSESLPTKDWEQQLQESLRSNLIDEDAATALRRVHTQLEEAARREELMRLLYDISKDLSAIRDVEVILEAIVRRTRSLIGGDIVYLSLNDYESNETYVRVTNGATTAAFRNIRIPLGGGVLGDVATGKAPAQSSDYVNDTTKSHFPDSDAAVIAEGVKAIMGVPLWTEGKVIGALLVADRRVHEFSNDDIDLMQTIAAHAAVALENARLFTEMTGTLEQLNESQYQNLQHVKALEALTSLDQRLMESLATDDILPSLQRLVASTLDAEVWILDPGGSSIAAGAAPEVSRTSITRQAAEKSRKLSIPTSFSDGVESYNIMSAVAGSQHFADILVLGSTSEILPAVLERSVLALSTAMLFERTLRDAQYRIQRELFDELLGPKTEITDALKERAHRFGITDDVSLVVRIVGTHNDQRQRALIVLRRTAKYHTGLVAMHNGYVCIIEPPSQEASGNRDAGSYIVDLLARENIEANVGSSTPVYSLNHLSSALGEAHSVLNALDALDRRGEAADLPMLGTAGMLLGAMETPFAQQLLIAQLGPLLEYDERRDTELVQTAWVYLDADKSHTHAAKRLQIHPNTMRQRLNRIDNILRPDWRQGGRALDMHVALRLWRLRNHGISQTSLTSPPSSPVSNINMT